MYTNHRRSHWLQRAERYQVDFTISAQTFGTGQIFTVHTCNVSESGLLISVADQNVPWNSGTLLELTIDPSEAQIPNLPEEKLNFTVKVVRFEKLEEDSRFGLQIIDMEIKEKAHWHKVIRIVEDHFEKPKP